MAVDGCGTVLMHVIETTYVCILYLLPLLVHIAFLQQEQPTACSPNRAIYTPAHKRCWHHVASLCAGLLAPEHMQAL